MALLVAVLTTLFAPTYAGWSNTEIESFTACTTQYGPASNNTQQWNPWISTDTYTTTTWARFFKTEILTPKPSTTTLSATSTSTYYHYPGDNMTTTVYTNTYFETVTSTQTETIPSSTTLTVSQVETITVPTLEGFVAVASATPEAAKRPNDWDNSNDWDVEDVYWTSEPSNDYPYTFETLDRFMPLYRALPTNMVRRQDAQSSQPLRVACTLTVQSNGFWNVVSIKQSGLRATYTRTKIVATVTSTSTVRLKVTAPPASTVFTLSDDYYFINTSYTTETTTAVETSTETVHPSTTTVFAACNTANMIDSYNGYPLREPPSWFSNPNANYTRQQIYPWDSEPVYSAEGCCARAVADPKTILWKYSEGSGSACEIWKGDATSCPAAAGYNGTSGEKVDANVYYEPTAYQGFWYSFDVGNGACGNIGFESLWE